MQSKRELLEWINCILNSNILTIESLGRGVEYSHLLSLIDTKFPVRLIINNPSTEVEYLRNLKLCKDHFATNNITVHFPLDRMCKCKVQDNLEFMQWLYKYFTSKYINKAVNKKEDIHKQTINNKENDNKSNRKFNNNGNDINNKQSIDVRQNNKQINDADQNKDDKSCTEYKQTNNVNEEERNIYNDLTDKFILKECDKDSKYTLINDTNNEKQVLLTHEVDNFRSKINHLENEISVLQTAKTLNDRLNDTNRLLEKEVKKRDRDLLLLEDQLKFLKEELDFKSKQYEELIIKHIENVDVVKRDYTVRIIEVENECKAKMAELSTIIDKLQVERNFYYMRLKEVEMFVKNVRGDNEIMNVILEILYKNE